jgi:AhpD family alkylhydroperoxidase
MDVHEKAARCVWEDVENLAERHFVAAVGELTRMET